MKFLTIAAIALLVTGCSLKPPFDIYGESNLLDVAPKNYSDVKYPTWGNNDQTITAGVKGPFGQTRTDSYDSLEHFLLQNGIDYEVLPGNYIMVKLKDTIKFKTGSSVVSRDSSMWLDKMGNYLATEPGIDVVISGHADNTGPVKFNDGLSIRRAKAVKQKLINHRVSQDAIYTRGYGEFVPACTNETRWGKACNRRVEVMFIVSNN
ncbi:OmpA family protein [Vibrio marisflavi]|uniref:Peptidoglycan-associated lipoprotein n=1 Tax=Vibrio marisflavi CECT 7928 TaxID=634439 RepID=A0ABN8E1C0_9VIBR|nr:OmpA family protein [Vibrio marisflavi]CAH0536564.1 Peptidoglycan-associated lipoprotein [Vibrio marisflavi CECT 7928]